MAAVQRIPDLRFVIEGVYEGIDTIVTTYRNKTIVWSTRYSGSATISSSKGVPPRTILTRNEKPFSAADLRVNGDGYT
jgi:hypothetical protein